MRGRERGLPAWEGSPPPPLPPPPSPDCPGTGGELMEVGVGQQLSRPSGPHCPAGLVLGLLLPVTWGWFLRVPSAVNATTGPGARSKARLLGGRRPGPSSSVFDGEASLPGAGDSLLFWGMHTVCVLWRGGGGGIAEPASLPSFPVEISKDHLKEIGCFCKAHFTGCLPPSLHLTRAQRLPPGETSLCLKNKQTKRA